MVQISRLRRKALAALLAASLPCVVMAQAREPVRIGLLSSKSGVFATQGEEVIRAIQFAVDDANAKGGVDGRKVEVSIADDESTPEGGRKAAEKLARDGYPLLVGGIPTSIALAVGPNLERWDALYVVVAAKSDKITGDSCRPRMFHTNHSDAMDVPMIAEWAKSFNERTYATFAADYVWGRDSSETFTKVAKLLGREVKLSLFAPVGTKDFSPYIAQLKEAKVDAIWVAQIGRDAIAFMKQAQEFGLVPNTHVIGHSIVQNFMIAGSGTALEGVPGNTAYSYALDNPNNKAFVAAWKAKFNRLPTDNEGMAYVGAQVIFEGVRKSKSVKAGDVAKAVRGAVVDTVHGQVLMRAEDNQLMIPNYIVRAKTVDGQLRPVLERTFPASIAPPPSPACKM